MFLLAFLIGLLAGTGLGISLILYALIRELRPEFVPVARQRAGFFFGDDMPTYNELREEYARLWASMEIRPSKAADIEATASKIISRKTRYKAVQDETGVPWFVVGVIHAMEGGCDFATHLHNGDSLARRTVQVPAGRPKAGTPPFSWKESACDALNMKSLGQIKDWSAERICYELERYNGWGYRTYHASVLSPYLWSGTNHYSRGKYIADGKWSSSAVSGQSGAMAILKRMAEMDSTIEIGAVIQAEPADIEESVATAAEAFPRAEPAAPAKAAELAPMSRKASLAQKIRDWLLVIGIGGGGMSVADAAGLGKGYIDGLVVFLKDHGAALFVLGCFAGVVVAGLFLRWMGQDYRDGRWVPSKE